MVEKSILIIKWLMYAIGQLPFAMRIAFILSILGIASAIYIGTISVLIFNYYIIPGIEKRLGKSFEYDPLYNYIFLSRWMIPQTEVALYIVRRYCALIFKGEHGLPKKRNRFALKKIGYTIDMASNFEIVMSLLWMLNVSVVIFCGIAVVIINKIYPNLFP